MNIKLTSLGFLGVSIGMGAILSVAPINPVQAAIFKRDIVDDNGNRMGRMEFTWNDNKVIDNILKGFDSLNSFSLKSYGDIKYDFDFALNAQVNKFEFNLTNGELHTYAYNSMRVDRRRVKYGFEIQSQDFDSDLIASSIPVSNLPNQQSLDEALKNNIYKVDLNLAGATSSDSTNPSSFKIPPYSADGAKFVLPQEQDSQSVPENSLTTALLIIAGLVFFSPHKIF